jgi:hypothetical protein
MITLMDEREIDENPSSSRGSASCEVVVVMMLAFIL